MKKYLLLLLVFLGMAVSVQAQRRCGQPDAEKLKEINEYRLKYLAQEMELTDEQKPKFVELYNQMTAERKTNFDKLRAAEKKLKGNLSDAEYKAQVNVVSDCKVHDAQIVKDYDAKFEKFLSAKQIYKMKEAEEKFRKRLREMHQQRKHDKKKTN